MGAGDEQWAVLGDTWCMARLHRVIEPEKALPSTKFLMHINATIRLLKHPHLGDNINLDDEQEDMIVDILLEEENWKCDEKDVTIELEYFENVNADAIFQALSQLQVPLPAQESLVDTILFQSFESARNRASYADRKILHMEITIDLYVI